MSDPNAPFPSPARAALAAAALCLASSAAAQGAEKVRHIADNSFLIEEAFNQEDGVVHQMSTFMRDRSSGNWVGTFTQEWPVVNEDHQFSYTVTAARATAGGRATTGPGDLALHYRYQALSEVAGVSLAPRITALAPSGDGARGLGAGGWGVQGNVPLSLDLGPWLIGHTNLGATWVPDGRVLGRAVSSTSLAAGQGLILRVHPRFNLLTEALWTRTWSISAGERTRADAFLVSPGFRAGFDFRSGLQIVTGVAAPIGVGPSAGSVAVLGYLSFELPFSEVGKRNAPGGPVGAPPAFAERPAPALTGESAAKDEVASASAGP
jgi:hypothetical protein